MSSTKFISLLSLLAVFLLTPFASASPLLRRDFTPGSGGLVAWKDGMEVGCLDSSWKLVAGPEGCGVFTVTDRPNHPRYYSITSEKGSCGYQYQFVVPQPESHTFLLACGIQPGGEDGFYDSELQFWTDPNLNQTILRVALARNYITVGERFPTGTEALNVTTDGFLLPSRFELVWKPSV